MRDGTSEYALLVCFTNGIQAHLPLGTEEKLASPDFPVPLSVIIGENDWVKLCDMNDQTGRHFGEICVEANQKKHGKEKSQFYWCPNSGHNLHMDNHIALENIILNDVFVEDHPILPYRDYIN